jgi:hypothetical protein
VAQKTETQACSRALLAVAEANVGGLNMEQVDPKSPHVQTALAMAALAVAVAGTLQELLPRAEALVTLQRKVQVEQARLRQTPDAEMAAAIFGFVRDALRNPDVIVQPDDC